MLFQFHVKTTIKLTSPILWLVLWPFVFRFQLICIKHYVRSNSSLRPENSLAALGCHCHCHWGLGPGAKDAKLDATGWTRPLPWSGEGGSWLARLWGRSIRCSKRFREWTKDFVNMGDEVIADKFEGCLPHKSCTKKIAWHTRLWFGCNLRITSWPR